MRTAANAVNYSPSDIHKGAAMSGSRAGGYVCCLDIADDDFIVASNDITNCHYRAKGDKKWTMFLRRGDNFTPTEHATHGNWGITVAPTNSNYMAAVIDGYFWWSSDKGQTVTKMPAFARNTYCDHGNSCRYIGKPVKFDPAGTNTVVVVDDQGALFTHDSGNSFVRASGIQSPLSFFGSAAVNAGGSGYHVNDTLTCSGGTVGNVPTLLTVTSVDGNGAITGVSPAARGGYVAAPTNPVAVTGGAGSGANFNMTFWGYDRTAYGCVSFNRSSTVVNGYTQDVVVMIPGRGIYRSTTGVNGAFTLIPGQPEAAKWFTDVRFDKNGKLHCIGDLEYINQDYYNWTPGGGWTHFAGMIGQRTASDPATGLNVYIMTNGGGPGNLSKDGGVTWTDLSGASTPLIATDIPWLQTTVHAYLSIGDFAWCNTTNDCIYSDGVGVWKFAVNLTAPYSTPRTSMSLGIDQLITQGMLCVPANGDFHVTSQDRTSFSYTRDNVKLPAAKNGVQSLSEIVHGSTAIDYAIDDPNWVAVGLTGAQGPFYGHYVAFSPDRGNTWFPSVNQTPELTYCALVAVSNKGTMLIQGANNGKLYFTTDFGANWTEVLSNGTSFNNNVSSIYLTRCNIVADKTVPNTFYVYGTNAADTLGISKIVITGPTTYTLTRMSTSLILTTFDDVAEFGRLRMPWNKTGHLFWTGGQNWNNAYINYNNTKFSPDGGQHWGYLPTLYGVTDINFGAPAPGKSYPTLYAAGGNSATDSMTYGLYMMTDFGFTFDGTTVTTTGTWQPYCKWPMGIDNIWTAVAADPGLFGRAYLGSAAGQVVVDYFDPASGH